MKVLMVSTEYPPVTGGIGRYTANLVSALRKAREENNNQAQIQVACSDEGNGDFGGLSPENKDNSEVLLKIVEESKPDLVHIQFEPGLYGLFVNPVNPTKSSTYLDAFYEKCRLPIVTTFHSAYNFWEWIGQSATMVRKDGKTGRFGIPARIAVRTWKSIAGYTAFHDLNREKLRQSAAGIVFSTYMSRILGGGSLIYHGAESAILPVPSKEEARNRLSLPLDKKIAMFFGFRTISKGWDILEKIKLPEGWIMVTNSSKSRYNNERLGQHSLQGYDSNIIDLKRGFLSEEELSMLMCASDIVLLPYKIASGSGVMFDALGHGLPFVASDLEFFREFSGIGLGITAARRSQSFTRAIKSLDEDYDSYSARVNQFREKLRWDNVARQHIELYRNALVRTDLKHTPWQR